MESLALKYRPRRFEDLAGQTAVQVILRQMVATSRVPTAMLFDGSRGTGKTTTARILAAALNCESTPVPCGHCVSCKSTFDGTSLDVLEIDAASNGLVDHIRDLRQQVLYRVGGNYRIVILDEAHSMSNAAFNALLKTLEEPPPATVFILCTTERRKILDTVASRCMPFTFRKLTVADITGRLRDIAAAETLHADDDLIAAIAERAAGAMRDAVMLLDQMTRVGVQSANQFHHLMGDTDTGPALLEAITTGRPAFAYEILREQLTGADSAGILAGLTGVLRDTLILNGGGSIPADARRSTLATQISTDTAYRCMRILWDLKTRTHLGDDALEIAVALLTALFTPTPEQPSALRRLGIDDMRF